MHSDSYELILFKPSIVLDITKHFDAGLSDLDLDSRPQAYRKAKLRRQLSHKGLGEFQWNLLCC